MVKKCSNDEWRLCSDFRNLNLKTVTDSYVIPILLGLLNFFSSFLPSAAKMLQPPTATMKKSAEFCLGEDKEMAFNSSD